MRVFRSEPSIEAYREIRRMARQCGRWDVVRPELLPFVRDLQFSGRRALFHPLDQDALDQELERLRSELESDPG